MGAIGEGNTTIVRPTIDIPVGITPNAPKHHFIQQGIGTAAQSCCVVMLTV